MRAISSEQAAWCSTAWRDDVNKWIAGRLVANNLEVNGAISEIKATDLSLVLRIPTRGGDVYFKATPGAAQHENRLTRYLSALLGKKVPRVVAIDESRPWMLMRDVGGRSLRDSRDETVWKQAIEDYAAIQVLMADHVNELVALGVPDRRMPVLRSDIEIHLEGMCATGLSAEETAAVMALQAELLAMCDQLDGSVPPSLDHGDLHSANIRLRDDEVVFFDWGDATVSHPFFSTAVFWNALEELAGSEDEWPHVVERFKLYYLAVWGKHATSEELWRLSSLSDQLACVYRALSWYLYINPARSHASDTHQRPAQWLRVLLSKRGGHTVSKSSCTYQYNCRS